MSNYQVFDSQLHKFYNKLKRTVWFIEVTIVDQSGRSRGTGTGFALKERGLVMTCAHVVVNSESIGLRRLDDPTLKLLSAKTVAMKPEWDIALIEITNLPTNFSWVPTILAVDGSVQVGEILYSISNPSRLVGSFSVSEVLVDVSEPVCEEHPVILSSSVGGPGSSGGPFFNAAGEVVGMHKGRIGMHSVRAGAYSVSVHLSLLKAFLRENKKLHTEEMSSRMLSQHMKGFVWRLEFTQDDGRSFFQTGFVVSEDGLIMTSAISDCGVLLTSSSLTKIYAKKWGTDHTYEAKILDSLLSLKYNVSMLRLTSPPTPLNIGKFVENGELFAGQFLYYLQPAYENPFFNSRVSPERCFRGRVEFNCDDKLPSNVDPYPQNRLYRVLGDFMNAQILTQTPKLRAYEKIDADSPIIVVSGGGIASGSPLVNECGQIVGMISTTILPHYIATHVSQLKKAVKISKKRELKMFHN